MINIEHLSIDYQDIKAVEDISFQIKLGDYIAIVGPNGSGKTSLIKALLGLIPFKGEISYQNNSLPSFLKKNHIGYLPQRTSALNAYFPATAQEIVLSGGYCCKTFPKRLTKEDILSAQRIMHRLDIEFLASRPMDQLSGGQQQRVLLARALIHQPHFLILDEPTSALDPESRESFYETIKQLNQKEGVTILLVSHDIGSVGQYASKMLYLDKKIIFYGTFEDFCHSSSMSKYFGAGQHIICHRH